MGATFRIMGATFRIVALLYATMGAMVAMGATYHFVALRCPM